MFDEGFGFGLGPGGTLPCRRDLKNHRARYWADFRLYWWRIPKVRQPNGRRRTSRKSGELVLRMARDHSS